MNVNRFILENILSRTIGGVFPPYWLLRKSIAGETAGEFTSLDSTQVLERQEFENDVLELSDAELENQVRSNALGIPMVMPLEIQLPESEEMWLLPWEPIITLKGKNIIVRRNSSKSEKRGSIKEFWTQDDYDINIEGILMDTFDENRYPREDVEILRSICEARRELRVNSPLLEIFGISHIVIEDYSIPYTKGTNTQGYSFKAYSDDLFELLIDDTTLMQK